MSITPTLFVIDDDQDWLLELQGVACAMGIEFQSFDSPAAFLKQTDAPGVLLLATTMEAMDWLSLRDAMGLQGRNNPMILMTGAPDARMIVEAMRQGAESVIVKPCGAKCLQQVIAEGLASDAERRKYHSLNADVQKRFDDLTPQERDVMWQIVDGSPNKVTARRIGVSVRTIENRRRSLFAKLAIRSVAELVAMVLQSAPPRRSPSQQDGLASDLQPSTVQRMGRATIA